MLLSSVWICLHRGTQHKAQASSFILVNRYKEAALAVNKTASVNKQTNYFYCFMYFFREVKKCIEMYVHGTTLNNGRWPKLLLDLIIKLKKKGSDLKTELMICVDIAL